MKCLYYTYRTINKIPIKERFVTDIQALSDNIWP